MHVMEHEYFAKGLTETALTTLWVALTKHFCSVHACKASACTVLKISVSSLRYVHGNTHTCRYLLVNAHSYGIIIQKCFLLLIHSCPAKPTAS